MDFDGECIKKTFLLVANNPLVRVAAVVVPESRLKECCGDFSFKAFAISDNASPDYEDEFKNDRHGFIFRFDSTMPTATLKLFKFDFTLNDYAFLSDLNNNNYGTFKAYNFFTNIYGEKHIGYQLEWRKVMSLHGAGSYKVRASSTSTIFGTNTQDSFEFCVNEFTPDRANGTVRIEYNLNSIIGDNLDDLKSRDFGTLNWYSSIRVPGYFGYPTEEYTKTFDQYNSGERVYLDNEQEPEFVLKLKPVFYAIHELMRTDIMQADAVYMTDYNTNNPGSFIQKAVYSNSEYKPEWKPLQSKLAPVTVRFLQTFNNLRKLFC